MSEPKSSTPQLRCRKLLLLAATTFAVIAGPIVFRVLAAPPQTQSPAAQAPATQAQAVPQWQTDAGGKQAFDSGSVKPGTSVNTPRANFTLDAGDYYVPDGGHFSATNDSLNAYIGFAYKLTPYQAQSLRSQLPKWATTERFDIDAQTKPTATKDQMRLMMQSLLADRFKLAAHFETRQLPLFALTLVNAGKTGPRLQPHSDNPPCSAEPMSSANEAGVCGVLVGRVVSGRVQMSARNIGMGYFASLLVLLGNLDRTVSDQTGLDGKFDLTMDAPFVKPPTNTIVPTDPSAPTFQDVLRSELGLKLEPQTGPVDVLVIDHVEEPAAN